MLLLLSISIADFGTLFYVHLAIENGVSQATRYAVTGNLVDDPLKPGSKLSREDSIKTIMRQATPTLTISDSLITFTHCTPGPGVCAWLGGSGGPGDIGKVEVGYSWKFLNPLLWPFFPLWPDHPHGRFGNEERKSVQMKTRIGLRQRFLCASGQSIVEFAIILPLVLVLVLGVVEFSYELLDLHVVTKLSREGSNLISRDTSLLLAKAALVGMSSRPVDFDNGSKLIFSVIKTGVTTGTSNFNKQILYQRYEYGTLSSVSALNIAGAGSFPAPDYEAVNADGNTGLQLTNLPASLVGTGGMIYVTEIYTKHTLITPFDRFGFKLPETLYSIAYF